MHISELRIRNFRNFLKGRFVFRKGVNTLIGENGSGKTNALHALRLLLDDALPRNSICLREADFSRALGDWKGHWIVIAVDFEELDPSEGCQILRHATGHMDESDTGTHTLLFRPRLEIRKRLHEMTCDGKGKNEIREHLDSITVDAYESVLTGRAEADFLEDDTYTRLVGNFEDGLFPNPDDDDQAELGVKVGPLHPEISCTFAPALRDVMSDLRGYRSNPLLALLRGTESSIQIEDAQKITAVVIPIALINCSSASPSRSERVETVPIEVTSQNNLLGEPTSSILHLNSLSTSLSSPAIVSRTSFL